jgi:hypothetical protein
MSLQQVYSSPSGQFGQRLPATATVQAADDLLRRRGPSTSDRIRLLYMGNPGLTHFSQISTKVASKSIIFYCSYNVLM